MELLVVKSIALASANYVHLLETSIPSHRPTSPQFQLNAFVGAVEREDPPPNFDGRSAEIAP